MPLHYRHNTIHPSLIKHLEPELNPVSFAEVSHSVTRLFNCSDVGRPTCSDLELEQFYCRKHILKAICLDTPAAHLFTLLLEAITIDNLDLMMPQFISDAASFRNANLISQGTMEKLEKYCGVKFYISESRVLPAVDLLDPTARAKWAIGDPGSVSRCSNHAEVNHHHGNARVHANSNFAVD